MTAGWLDVFAPLAKRCREIIEANPHLGCT